MIFEVIFEIPHNKWSVTTIFQKTVDDLKVLYPEHTFHYVDVRPHYPVYGGGFYSPHFLVVRNPLNLKYILASYWDDCNAMFHAKDGWDVDNRPVLIGSAGKCYDKDKNIPFTYPVYNTDHDSLIEQIITDTAITKDTNKLFFRGYLYDFRKFLECDDDIIVTNKLLNSYEYLLEIRKSKIGLSLNGAGEICNRDIEILGLGTALFRPKLQSIFYNPLIPDYHYISFDVGNSFEETRKNLKEKYEMVKNSDDLINHIAENGRNWYLKNGTIEANKNLLIKLIDLKKII